MFHFKEGNISGCDVIGGFRQSFFVYLGDIWCFLCCTLHYFQGMGKKQQQKRDCSREETDLIKCVT